MIHEPGLRFWVRYAEREGALVEDGGDLVTVVLPEPLQAAAQMSEEAVVTSSPDVAREDGAVLLIAGHPALERAAAAVLGEGDAGTAFLPWPAAAPPAASRLQALARERFDVAHGRIDAAGHARAAYAPLLRVGATVSYSASLTQRVQEQEEAWVDARTGLAPPQMTVEAAAGMPWLPRPDTRHGVLQAALAETLPAAHAELERRAGVRAQALAGQARRALAAELARADAYYRDQLEALERRLASAPPDRRRLLDAQRDATRAEHARRRREIEEEHRAGHEIRPFRLHLIHVPALVLDVEIRRGARTFPFAFTWLLRGDAFAAVRCPHCGGAGALVAGRERLGCAACLARPTPMPAVAEPPGAGTRGGQAPAKPASTPPEPAKPAGTSPQAGRAPGSPAGTPPEPAGRAGTASRRERAPAPRSAAAPPRRPKPHATARRPGQGIERTGNKLAFAFWQAVAAGERWPRKKVAAHSPLSALYRLYGAAGPLCAVGLPPAAWPSEFTAGTHPPEPGFPELTTGALISRQARVPYALSWWLEAGRPVVAEVSPGARLGRGISPDVPAPRVELDPVAAALWRAELAASGLPFVVRALATWWRVEDLLTPGHDPRAVAGALSAALSRASALGRRRAELAELHGVPLAAIERVEREAGRLLKLDRNRGW